MGRRIPRKRPPTVEEYTPSMGWMVYAICRNCPHRRRIDMDEICLLLGRDLPITELCLYLRCRHCKRMMAGIEAFWADDRRAPPTRDRNPWEKGRR